ncbi:MAG: phosphotransferase [Alphaproteobacteria bacterium]|nr:phosphotransferase [Alphaproteobacteria bacterium]
MSQPPDTEIAPLNDVLARLGISLLPGAPIVRLTGGVSCDIFRVETSEGPVCVKQALERLRVAADWQAPVERSHAEVMWLRLAERLGRPRAPHVIAESPDDHLFVMNFLPPDSHANWKSELSAGRVDPAFAAMVGRDLAFIHARTAYSGEAARDFANGAMFHALRIEPYLLHTATRHPDLAARLHALAQETLETEIALVHGDVSPKNILVGPDGPVFLDAECAWFGDPGFDIAFCLTHLLLKAVWRPANRAAYFNSFEALQEAYFGGVTWEPRAALDVRAGALLAALLLARIDGKSPVEYLTEDADKALVRRLARPLLAAEAVGVAEIGWAFADALDMT